MYWTLVPADIKVLSSSPGDELFHEGAQYKMQKETKACWAGLEKGLQKTIKLRYSCAYLFIATFQAPTTDAQGALHPASPNLQWPSEWVSSPITLQRPYKQIFATWFQAHLHLNGHNFF